MYGAYGQHAPSSHAGLPLGQSPVGRGILISLIAVLSTAVAHCIAASNVPSLGAIVLAVAVLTPACAAITSSSFSRSRLLGLIIGAQAALHGLFCISAEIGSTEVTHSLLTNSSCSALLAHAAALGLTYASVRRGDELIEILQGLLSLTRKRAPEPATDGPVTVRVSLTSDVWQPAEARPDNGPQPLRGPPAFVL